MNFTGAPYCFEYFIKVTKEDWTFSELLLPNIPGSKASTTCFASQECVRPPYPYYPCVTTMLSLCNSKLHRRWHHSSLICVIYEESKLRESKYISEILSQIHPPIYVSIASYEVMQLKYFMVFCLSHSCQIIKI
jgi:hypothetical protein